HALDVRDVASTPITSGAPHVAIIGAGIAGLAAAFHLRRAGWAVTIFERQQRVGGRALTLRQSLSPGLLTQAGPARFPWFCSRVVALAKARNVAMEPFYPADGALVGFFDGQRIADYQASDAELWGFPT